MRPVANLFPLKGSIGNISHDVDQQIGMNAREAHCFIRPSLFFYLNLLMIGSQKISRVCVIGGGAAGLVCGSELLRSGVSFEILEKSKYIGGVWKYVPNKSVMYGNLRTNLPKEIMPFDADHMFDNSLRSFITHNDVDQYLTKFYHDEGLENYTRLGCEVIDCFKSGKSWVVRSKAGGKTIEDLYDALIIANGHYDLPFSPPLEGIEHFQGTVMHSREYDDVEVFRGKTVLVVGTKSSGTDMAREISSVASLVHLSDRGMNDSTCRSYGNIIHRPALRAIVASSGDVEFMDGEQVHVDIILWCTGFLYDYPFFGEDAKIHLQHFAENKRRVGNLYQQLLNINDPTVAFVGLPFSVVPFVLFRAQARWLAAVFSGRLSLPPKCEQAAWLREHEERLHSLRLLDTKYHFLGGDAQFHYVRGLARASMSMSTHADDEEHEQDGGVQETAEVSAHEKGTDEGRNEGQEERQGEGRRGGRAAAVADAALDRFIRFVDVVQSIYNDVGANRPPYPGAPDVYRDREYRVDR